MKIYIVGSSCVGKTTLARKLSEKFNIESVDLDRVFINLELLKKNKNFGFVSPREYKARIKKILKKRDWIIEGVYPVKEIFESADVVVHLHRCLIKPLFWQWKRFFTDEKQRKTFGLKNNLWLTSDIIRQYTDKCDKSRMDDPTYFSNDKLAIWLEQYKRKIKEINDLNLIK